MIDPERIKRGLYWQEAWSLIGGCTPVSPGCDHCWSAKETHMRANNPNEKVKARNEGLTEGGCFNGKIRLNREFLDKPLRKQKPTIYAVWNDLFHPDVPFEFIDCAFAVMASSMKHTFLVLTKRAERMYQYMQRVEKNGPEAASKYTEKLMNFHKQHIEKYPAEWMPPPPPKPEFRFLYDSAIEYEAASSERESMFYHKQYHWRKWPLSNVWLGVTAENQEQADKRIPILLQTPAAVRYVSVEPMLGPVDLDSYYQQWQCPECGTWESDDRYCTTCSIDRWDFGELDKTGIDWIVCGGESGPGARPCHPDWARSLRDQCQAAGVPFFFKQWGQWYPFYDRDIDDPDWRNVPEEEVGICRLNLAGGHGFHGDRVVYFKRVGKKKAGRLLDGRTWDEMPGVGHG